MNQTAEYDNVLDLLDDIDNEEHLDPSFVEGYDNKGELYLYIKESAQCAYAAGTLLFQRYYGSHAACTDVCLLLGLDEPQSV